ncbi:MAG TPA: glycosyltransferase [Thermoanaerobaculia bacterium]
MAAAADAMKVLLTGDHDYPLARVSAGRRPKPMPSGSAQRVHELIAKGLAELGHEVVVCLANEPTGAPPPGIRVTRTLERADILHTYALRGPRWEEQWRGPYVATVHLDPRTRGVTEVPAPWIFASRTMAQAYGRTRYVVNGIDPAEYRFEERAGDYLLFMAAMDNAVEKGLAIAVETARRTATKLVVAGTARTQETIDAVTALCREAEYVGDVQGEEKAELLANAKALLFPSQLNEVCPVAVAEALMSGTPVIASASGALPELVRAETGFVCRTAEEYVTAVERIGTIDRHTCRAVALREFHYLRMAGDYIDQYRREIGQIGPIGQIGQTRGAFVP